MKKQKGLEKNTMFKKKKICEQMRKIIIKKRKQKAIEKATKKAIKKALKNKQNNQKTSFHFHLVSYHRSVIC